MVVSRCGQEVFQPSRNGAKGRRALPAIGLLPEAVGPMMDRRRMSMLRERRTESSRAAALAPLPTACCWWWVM